MKERGRGGVVQNFQTGGSDPAKQVISERVRRNESVPGWVVSIEVSKDKSVRRVWKDVGIEGPTQTTPVLKFFFPTTLLYNSLTSTPLPLEALLLTLAPGPFQHFRFQPFSSKWFLFRFHKKLTASSFCFHIPGKNQC